MQGQSASYISGNPFGGGESRLDGRQSIVRCARRILMANGYDPSDRRNDSLTVAFARELEDVIKEVFDVEYPALRAREFLPERMVSADAATFTYRMYDRVGQADFIDENASNIPKVDLKAKEWQQPVLTWGASYDFTFLDQMRSGRLGISVDSLKAEAARWACEYKNEQLACFGDATVGLVGLVNAVGVSPVAQVSSGTWLSQIAAIGTATTTNATPPAVVVAQAIGQDIGAMIDAVYTNTDGIHEVTDVLLPVQLFNKLRITPQSPGYSAKSLLSYLQELYKGDDDGKHAINFHVWPQLNAADVAGTNGVHGMVVAYERDPKVVNLMMAQNFTQAPPERKGLAWEIITYMRGGAAQVRYPLAVVTMKGLG